MPDMIVLGDRRLTVVSWTSSHNTAEFYMHLKKSLQTLVGQGALRSSLGVPVVVGDSVYWEDVINNESAVASAMATEGITDVCFGNYYTGSDSPDVSEELAFGEPVI